MHIKLLAILVITIFAVIFAPSSVNASAVSFNLTVNSGSANPNDGNFVCNGCSLPLAVTSGDSVSLTFAVPANDPYCCGIQVKANNGQFDTGTINQGASQVVNFTAANSFTFTAYWPGTGTVKAIANVNVTAAVVPSSTTVPTTAPNMPTNTNAPVQPTPATIPVASKLPGIPANLKAIAISSSQIELSWSAAAGATGYQIYRNGVMIKFVSTLFYSDSSLSPDTSYGYKILATNSYGSSGFSADAAAKTLAAVVVAAPLTTSAPANTLAPGQTLIVTPEVTGIPDDDIFIDTTQSYAAINNIVYAFNYLEEIKPGDQFLIYGRTVALAEITVTVSSTPREFTTVADDNGYWHLAVDTTNLTAGEHSFTTLIKEGDRARLLAAVTFQVAGTAASQIKTGNPMGIAIMGFGVFVILAGFIFIYFKLIRTPSALQQIAGNQVRAFYGDPVPSAPPPKTAAAH